MALLVSVMGAGSRRAFSQAAGNQKREKMLSIRSRIKTGESFINLYGLAYFSQRRTSPSAVRRYFFS